MFNFKEINKKYCEIFGLSAIYLLLLINYFVFNDSLVAVLSAFFGITYTALAGKGNPICYLFGVSGSGLYGALSFSNALWGNLLLYLGYYIPMQVLGFFKWNKNLKDGKNEIIKTKLTQTEAYKIFTVTVILTVVAITILIYMHDKNPIIDGITTVFSLTGMYLTVKRCIEQWLVWILVNGLSVIMWTDIAISGEKVYSTVVMWTAYFILAIYFYFGWKKEVRN